MRHRADNSGISAAGTEPGQRRLNGPQTTGREYRNLSAADHAMTREDNVRVEMRDGAGLLADVHRPDGDGRFPVLVAASPYPRQIQDLGAPMGFIEAGASDFFVPRGYVHLIANLRSTGGSDGTFGLFDTAEARDVHDMVEWAAAQPWSNGRIGMIGISYFAMTQLAAAVERPEHLEAIFPVAVTPDLYEATYHNGLLNSTFVTPFLAAIGITAARSDEFWRGEFIRAARRVLTTPRLHARFAHMNGESSIGALHAMTRLSYEPEPWDELWEDAALRHQLRDDFWDERSVLGRLGDVDIPVYLGCDWENVPLHLLGTFGAWEALADNPNVRMGFLGSHGLTWPWESLHVEALAWFDHWLKDADTGIMEGDPIRYWLPGAEEWRTTPAWPPAEAEHLRMGLLADGVLAASDARDGERSYLCEGPGLNRSPHARAPSLPDSLVWETPPLDADLDMVGYIELELTATATAADTAWIATLQDVGADGTAVDVTAGYLRASLRAVDEPSSRPGAPRLPCRESVAVAPGVPTEYRIPLVPNARRFEAGHRIRLVLCSDDQPTRMPAIMDFRHAPVGTTSVNTVHAGSTLLLAVLPAADSTAIGSG